ncbi:MAG: methylenetetrahydrofolate reductase, partial [Anaerolineaceae bacterium]|nr:methylenetetrahydrofolate reductase [Anaerolineaceae bacterium]
LITQPIYQPELACTFLEHYQQLYGELQTPILAGILPLASDRHADFLHHEVPGITIPEPLRQRMRQAGENGLSTGVQIAIELIEQVRSFAQGIYLVPAFNRFDIAAEIIDAVRSKT